MNNSNLWYTESEVGLLLDYSSKQGVWSLRDEVQTFCVSNRYLYLRKDIDELLKNKYQNEPDIIKILLGKPTDYNIDLDEWMPLSDALEIVNFSRQRLYQLKNAGRVRTKEYDGFLLFNRDDLNAL